MRFVTCACFPVIVQGVSRQTEAVVGARGALTDVLTAVLRLQTQIHTCSRGDIRVIIGPCKLIYSTSYLL